MARKPKPSMELVTPKNALEAVVGLLSSHQQKVLHDPSRHIVVRCSRRAGKTYYGSAKLIHTALKFPGDTSVYFGLTRVSAKEAIWDELLKMLNEVGIAHSFSEAKLEITLFNGSKIVLIGADLDAAQGRLRGRKFRLVIIDECAFYTSVDKFILAVLQPTLADFAGQMQMTSSPGTLPKGLFYEADVGAKADKWSHHSWTGGDNPHFQQPASDPKFANKWEEELDLVVNMQFDGDRDHPTFRREWLGEWVFDFRSLCYPFDLANVIPQEGPLRESTYTLGLNVSSVSTFGAVIVKCGDYNREAQVVEATAFKSKDLNELATTLEEFIEEYGITRIVCYIGDHPPDIIDDFRSRYKLPITVARHEKLEYYQKIIATDMAAGYIKVVDESAADLIEEWTKIVKDDKGNEVEGQETLLSDAFYVVYLDVYTTVLKQTEEAESDETRMERQLLESVRAELSDYRDEYDYDAADVLREDY